MKAALEGVRAEAAMMRSPSFSREGESSTITNSSRANAAMVSGIESKAGWEGMLVVPFAPLPLRWDMPFAPLTPLCITETGLVFV